MSSDPRFAINADRAANRLALRKILEDILADKDGKALTQELLEKGIPAGSVQTVEDAMQHPQTIAREMVVTDGEYRGTGIPIKLSRTPGKIQFKPPQYGENNSEILSAAGYCEEEIQRFKDMQITLQKPKK